MSSELARRVIGRLHRLLKGMLERVVGLRRRLPVLANLEDRRIQRQLPSGIRRVLVVCAGNICRSPMGEVYLNHRARQAGLDIEVDSAGLETTPGKPAHPLARRVVEDRGLSLDRHATRQLRRQMVVRADVILVMERSQKRRLHRICPESRGKVLLLARLDLSNSLEIADPLMGSLDDFQRCYGAIQRSCDAFLRRLAARDSDGRLQPAGVPPQTTHTSCQS